MAGATANLLYRMGVEGGDQVVNAVHAVGSEEEKSANRAIAAADRKAERLAADERRIQAARKASADADVKAYMLATGASEEYVQSLRREAIVGEQVNAVRRQASVSTRQMRSAMTQVSYSFQDVFIQASMGQNILQALTIQTTQAAGAFAFMEGTAGKAARVMIGPWGLAFTAGALLLSTFIGRSKEAEAQTNDLSQAIDWQKMSVNELISAVKELEQAQRKQIQVGFAAEQQAYANAKGALTAAIAAREQAKANLENARSTLAAQNPMEGEGGVVASGLLVHRFDAQVTAAEEGIATARKLLREAQIPITRREVAAATDAAAAATLRYERAQASLEDRFVAGGMSEQLYRAQLAALQRRRDEEIKAAQEAERESARAGRAAEREARAAERAAAKSARELVQDLTSLEQKYDPVAAAARAYREELEKIAALTRAGLITGDTARDWGRRAAADNLGAAIGIDAIRNGGRAAAEQQAITDAAEEARQRDQRVRDYLARQSDAAEMATLELSLVRAGNDERARAVDQLRLIQSLRADGITAADAEYHLILRQHDAIADMYDAIKRQEDAWREARRFGEEFADTVLDPQQWDNWGQLGMDVLAMIRAELIKLALLNPFKNLINGDDSLPTLGNIGSLLGIGGSSGGGAGGASGGIASIGSMIAGFAPGTLDFPGGLALTGEHGPELARFPAGTRIHTAADTRRMLATNDQGSAPGPTFYIDARGADSAAVARLEAAVREMNGTIEYRAVEAVADAQQRINGVLGLR
ncbi:hypothetical protein [Stakelama tenebrarum]|uniref:Bacteriophage tail tape measure N-terminal domain-containing protein n=1 Tax=Stakelama tenebrarum TaxID=2711215 RepID=A0A6G6Y566_9SPHN|nr:hypothetical protein [Sphingosinithalassobacter tenebrarum]QIG79991.1 hypothetical protein G5C33_09525 [Sphingosinithalassobacter tenebrarum]